MLNPPYSYEQLNMTITSYTPNAIHTVDNESYRYWQRSLFQRILSTFRINNIPDSWKGNREFFLDRLLVECGYVVVVKDDTYGVYFAPATLTGLNINFQPTKALLISPDSAISGKEITLGVDGQLIQLTPDYMGLGDIVNATAEQLALLNTAVNTSLINSKQPYLLAAKTKAAAQALKKMIDNANQGECAVVISDVLLKDSPDGEATIEQFKLFSSTDYITDKLLNDRETILRQFNAEIGIPTPAEKRERMVTSEIDQRRIDSTARSRVWFECLKSSCEQVNKLFGLNLEPVLTVDEYNGEEINNENTVDSHGKLSES